MPSPEELRAELRERLRPFADPERDRTDAARLFDFCRRQADDRSFWIRKAVGWALRQHGRTDPDAVRAFLAEHGARLSGLSRREAAKHL